MKNPTLILILIYILPAKLYSQPSIPSITPVQSAPSGTCSSAVPLQLKTPDGILYSCQNGTWGSVASGGGGGSKSVYYILATGQSNVLGNNDGSGGAAINSNVLGWNGSAWVVMQEGVSPLGQMQLNAGQNPFNAPNVTFPNSNNPTWNFAKRLQQITGAQVKVILLGWGGNAISNWVGTSSLNYGYIQTVVNSLGISAIDYLIWDQGEADGAAHATDSAYLANLNTVIAQFRAESWFPASTPIILTGLDVTADPNYAAPHYAQRSLGSSSDPFIYFTETLGLPTTGGVHWTGPGTVTLGSQLYIDTIYNKRFKGLVQSMTTQQRNWITTYAPNVWQTGVIVNDSTLGSFYQWNGSLWVPLATQWTTSGSTVYYNAGNVGIGATPTTRLDVQGGMARFGASGYTAGSAGDISVSRESSPTTGAIYMGNSGTSNIFFSGSSFVLNGGQLFIPSSLGATFGGSAAGAANTTTCDAAAGARCYQYDGSGNLKNLMRATGFSYHTGGRYGFGTSTDDTINQVQIVGGLKIDTLTATSLPTSCSGKPTGTVAVVASVFTLCP